MDTGTHLVIRADAGPQSGIGHVMRCLALAEAWMRDAGPVTFLLPPVSEALEQRVGSAGAGVRILPAGDDDAAATAEAAASLGATWLVLDGRTITSAHADAAQAMGLRVARVDDLGTDTGPVDVVLNHNPYATPALYPRAHPESRMLLGARYALVRDEFRRTTRPSVPATRGDGTRRVLVTLGGGAHGERLRRIVETLDAAVEERLQVRLVVGPEAQASPELAAAAEASHHDVEQVSAPPSMADLMAETDVAISAAGSTAWELFTMGVPSLFLVAADDQHGVATSIEGVGCGLVVHDPQELGSERSRALVRRLVTDDRLQRHLADRARALIDGHGPDRVVQALLGRKVRVREATSADAAFLWGIANDPRTRAVSISTRPIEWDEHVSWLERVQADADRLLLIGIDTDDRPTCQVRYDRRDDGDAIISISTHPACRGHGFASAAIRTSLPHAHRRWQDARILAWVRPDNDASRRLFEKTGFELDGEVEEAGEPYLQFVRAPAPRAPDTPLHQKR